MKGKASAKRVWRLWSVCLLLGLTGCGGGDNDAESNNTTSTSTTGSATTSGATTSGGTANTLSYARDVAPIFQNNCVDCHHAQVSGIPNLVDPFAADTGLVGFINTWYEKYPDTPEMLVVPGDPDNSFLMQKIENPSALQAGDFMPWSPARLTSEEQAAIRQWISDGALDDSFFEASVRPIFGTAGLLGAPGGKCSYCHFAGGEEPNLSDPFDPQTGLVNVESDKGTLLRVAPGDPDNSLLMQKVTTTTGNAQIGAPMPLSYPALNANEVAKIRQWIADGAQNN